MRDDSTRQSVLFAGLFDKRVVAQFDQPHGSSDGGAVLLKSLDATLGLRVSDENESEGLDLAEHGEEGYTS